MNKKEIKYSMQLHNSPFRFYFTFFFDFPKIAKFKKVNNGTRKKPKNNTNKEKVKCHPQVYILERENGNVVSVCMNMIKCCTVITIVHII